MIFGYMHMYLAMIYDSWSFIFVFGYSPVIYNHDLKFLAICTCLWLWFMTSGKVKLYLAVSHGFWPYALVFGYGLCFLVICTCIWL